MWASSVGEDSATAEALVEILRPIPLTQDIVDRINNDCEWIFMVLQELTFLHRHPRERAGFRKEAKRGQSGFHRSPHKDDTSWHLQAAAEDPSTKKIKTE